jgi:uncharacterized protein (TIGR03435 family)
MYRRLMAKELLIAIGWCLLTAEIGAQEQSKTLVTFEVASIKPNTSGIPRVVSNPFNYSPNGRYTATNVTLVDIMVGGVYQTRRIQIRGSPAWIDSERFDISAMAPAGGGGGTRNQIKRDQWNAMIQGLLEDRFKLKVHRETRELPVYALVSGKTPPNLKESSKEAAPTYSGGDRGQLNFQHMPLVALVNTQHPARACHRQHRYVRIFRL